MKEDLYNQIRNKQVILFAGAGTSLYAGYPSGNTLKNLLYDSLTLLEKKSLDLNLPLPQFAEKFCRISNRDKLNSILNTIFSKRPTSISWHKKLAAIPHFETIITTNYDTLFEKGYGKNGRLIHSSTNLNCEEKFQTEIFKIHGDLSDLENLILTSGDYNRFFQKETNDSIFWNVIKSKMASNSILFIGYSLDDPNVLVAFDKICDELGTNRKDVFFLSPNTDAHEIKHLQSKGIKYIRMKADRFLIELKKEIDKNVVMDYEEKKISFETLQMYSKNQNMFPSIKNDGKYNVEEFFGIDKRVNKKMLITFTDGVQHEISEYLASPSFDKLQISAEKILDNTLSYNEILMPKKELLKFEIIPVPNLETKVDIKCQGFEYNDIPVKLFKKDDYAEIHASLKTATCILKFDLAEEDKSKIHIVYEHNKVCGKIKDEIEDMTLFKLIGEGKDFQIFPDGFESIVHESPTNNDFADTANHILQYFSNLKLIENHFQIRFDRILFDSIDEKNENLVNLIVAIIKNETIKKNYTGAFRVDLASNGEHADDIRELLLTDFVPVFPIKEPEVVNLHGIEINIGYKVSQLVESYIENLDSIKDKSSNIVVIKSKANLLLTKYTKEFAF